VLAFAAIMKYNKPHWNGLVPFPHQAQHNFLRPVYGEPFWLAFLCLIKGRYAHFLQPLKDGDNNHSVSRLKEFAIFRFMGYIHCVSSETARSEGWHKR